MPTSDGDNLETINRRPEGRQAKGMAEPMTTTARLQIQSDGSTSHSGLAAWVAEVAALTTPERISWVTGSDPEWKTLTDRLVASGTFTRLNEDIKPNSFHLSLIHISEPTRR